MSLQNQIVPARGAGQWWTPADREALLSVAARLRPRTVLEFGPGASTLALAGCGATWVDTFEDVECWYDACRAALAPHPQVNLHLYEHRAELSLPQALPRYDLGFVDGPRHTADRGPEIAYALARCRAVLCHDFCTDTVPGFLRALGVIDYPAHITGEKGGLYTGEWRAIRALLPPNVEAVMTSEDTGSDEDSLSAMVLVTGA